VALLAGAALVLVGCGDNEAARQRRLVDEINRSERTPPAGNLPQALLVRFQETRGSGLEREGWELEILQMGGDVVLRGQVRTDGTVVPIYRPMAPGEYSELWNWLRTLPFEGWEPRLDETAALAEWRKSLHADIVLGADRRILLRRRWQRPLVGDSWVSDLEGRFHSLALDLAREELARQRLEEAQAAASGGNDDPDPRNPGALPGVE
jgi:hypothetical protein